MEYFKASLLDEKATERCLVRMSHEIIEKNKGTDNLVLVGILRRGKPLAERIAENIARIEGTKVPCGDIDINYYRDDLIPVADSPLVRCCELPFSIVGKTVVLVDDVLYTGRTVRAAIEATFSLGRPKAIQLAILIDRGHRELPIRADYIGKAVATSKKEHIRVHIPPIDEDLGVSLFENRI